MSKKKKIILLIVAALVIAAAVFGLIYLRNKNNKAYVQSVADMNMTWVLMNESSYGTISDSARQQITLQPTDVVAEVFAVTGTTVKAGDPLFRYDTKSLELTVEEKQLTVDSCAGSLDIARQQLAAYEKIVPVADTPDEPDEPQPYQLTAQQKLPDQYHEDVTGQADRAYYCTDKTLVTGEQINQWIDEGLVVALQIWEGGQPPKAETPEEPDPAEPGEGETPTQPETPDEPETPQPLSQWIIDGRNWPAVEYDSFWSVADHAQWFTPEPELPDIPDTPTYTQAQKAKLISDQELRIRRLENSLALAQNALAQAKKNLDDATVRAAMDGTVTAMGDPHSLPQDGSPFCVVSGAEGVTLTGYISELDLAEARVGDKLSVTSWMTGTTTDAQITDIADYPADNGGYYGGEGNPNVSYYQFTAYMENAEGFNVGEEVSIQSYIEDLDQLIVLEKVYVRSDENGHYVLVDDGTGHLARRDVTVQSTSEVEYVKILSGLTLDDMVAFPYGKSARVGALTTTEMKWNLF